MSEELAAQIETCIILLRDASGQILERAEAFVKSKGGMVLVRLPEQRVLIVNIDVQAKRSLEALPEIEFVGGVRMRPRMVPRLRVRLGTGSSYQIEQAGGGIRLIRSNT